MILDQSDPTGVGLFSRAARSQAARLKGNRPSTPSRQLSVQHSIPLPKKHVRNSSAFSRQESRAQRERKYKVDSTPPVGQYNPSHKTRPKMVWDILKVFTNPNKPVEQNHLIKHSKVTPKTVPMQQTIIESSQSTPTQMEEALMEGSAGISETSKSRCMVNMSRMTGRRQQIEEKGDWGDVDVMHSLGYCRGSIAKNIYIGQSGQQHERKQNLGGSYSYDYTLFKPKRSCNMDFSRCLGRQQHNKKNDSHNYVHYDYDSYVWSGKSRVFPNTKTHVIDFKKQKNRYSQRDDPE